MAPSSLLAALNTAVSIILSNWSFPSPSKFISSNDAVSAIDDKTSNARVESANVSPTCPIVFIIMPLLSSFPFVIIFAKNIAPSSLLAALNTAFSINLLTSACPSNPKSTSFKDLASATEDKTFNERFAPSLFASDVSTKFIILSTVAPSDFEIILPINAMLLLLPSTSLNIWVYIFSLIALLASELEVVRKALSSLAKFVITLATRSLLISKILSIDWPMLASSDLFKTCDKNSVFSPVELSTIKSNFCCFSILIPSLITSMSDASITPSPLASKRLPFNNFCSKFFWITFSSIELASIKSLETSTNSFFSSSVLTLSEKPVSVFVDTTCSVSNKVFTLPADEILIVPTLPKLSSAKLTAEVPSGLFSILNLVPLIPKVILGSSIVIEPSFFFAILPDSIITDPFLTSARKIFFKPVILKSVTLNEDDFFIIMVELSLYWTVAVDSSFVTISSCNKISSYKSNNLFSPSALIAKTSSLRLTIDPIFSSE